MSITKLLRRYVMEMTMSDLQAEIDRLKRAVAELAKENDFLRRENNRRKSEIQRIESFLRRV